jgi:hypothetical protein
MGSVQEPFDLLHGANVGVLRATSKLSGRSQSNPCIASICGESKQASLKMLLHSIVAGCSCYHILPLSRTCQLSPTLSSSIVKMTTIGAIVERTIVPLVIDCGHGTSFHCISYLPWSSRRLWSSSSTTETIQSAMMETPGGARCYTVD